MEECRKIGGCETGAAVMTNAGNLKAKKIIHTPGPVWHGGSSGEPELLRNSYKNSFRLAAKKNLKTIALPAISTGVYGYPVDKATRIALEEGKKRINDFDEIRYICFSENDYRTYQKVYEELNK
jgi:O-acetyl-ADP-ribose deacetylase (regulator of RNase III)